MKIAQAIEAHRVRDPASADRSQDSSRGEHAFHFVLRDGRVRKRLVSTSVQEGLESGRYAIVENGDPETHAIVGSEALAQIREADAEAIRFFNDHSGSSDK